MYLHILKNNVNFKPKVLNSLVVKIYLYLEVAGIKM